VLVGLGITSLSMAARAVPLVGATLARLSLGDCAELARLAVEADTAASARAAVHERVRG
jgi:phosphotransferase system enzyme I (PtsI)